MGTRELKGLLRVLKDAGVASFASGDLRVTFRDPSEQAFPRETLPGGANPDASGQAGDLDLPDGVWDPTVRIAEMNRKRASRGKAAS